LASFRALPEHQLNGLSDEQLVDHMRAARSAGRHEAMKPAIAVLVYGYWDNLVNRARLKLPQADAEDVAAEAAASAIASAFDGRSVGEFRAWLHTILSRRIADYHEARRRRVKTTELPGEHAGEEDVWGDDPAVPFEGDALFAQQCLARAYDELEDDRHRQVIDLYVYGPDSAAQSAATVGDAMTEANVHQIASRFQRRFRELLAEGDTGGER
jgi:RNA polymerase sigma factor (sigma-70 family)